MHICIFLYFGLDIGLKLLLKRHNYYFLSCICHNLLFLKFAVKYNVDINPSSGKKRSGKFEVGC